MLITTVPAHGLAQHLLSTFQHGQLGRIRTLSEVTTFRGSFIIKFLTKNKVPRDLSKESMTYKCRAQSDKACIVGDSMMECTPSHRTPRIMSPTVIPSVSRSAMRTACARVVLSSIRTRASEDWACERSDSTRPKSHCTRHGLVGKDSINFTCAGTNAGTLNGLNPLKMRISRCFTFDLILRTAREFGKANSSHE